MQRINFAVKGFVLYEEKFLLMHKSEEKENLWELPGGRMEFGETAEETLIREIDEETGLPVKPIRVLDTWNSVYGDRQVTGIIYLCEVEKAEVRLSAEHDKFKWVNATADAIGEMYPWFREKMLHWNFASIRAEMMADETI